MPALIYQRRTRPTRENPKSIVLEELRSDDPSSCNDPEAYLEYKADCIIRRMERDGAIKRKQSIIKNEAVASKEQVS